MERATLADLLDLAMRRCRAERTTKRIGNELGHVVRRLEVGQLEIIDRKHEVRRTTLVEHRPHGFN